MPSHRLRRALHDALDIVLDALAEDAREAAGNDQLPPKKRRRKQVPRPVTVVTPEVIQRAAEMALKMKRMASGSE